MRDELDVIYADEQFRTLFPIRGRPVEAPWRLALVTIFQFAENLSDRQAADAVRSRIDWKYALSLKLTDPGFDASVLSEFRSRLVGRAATLFLDVLLERLKTQGLLKSNRQRTDSTHVLAAVSALNRLELVRETMRLVLETLAVVAPAWLQPYVQSAWRERYHPHFGERLPKTKEAQRAFVEQIGIDGVVLLSAMFADTAPVWLQEVPVVERLRQIWVQNYIYVGDKLCWRTVDEHGLPASNHFISSPHDLDARYSQKHSTSWIGYKVHEGGGFAARDFTIDWKQQHAICPVGKRSTSWTPAIDRFKNEVIKIKFATTDCQDCASQQSCTRSTPPRRTITIRPQAQHEALLADRKREQTAQYKATYAQRAGVEGTIAQSVRSCHVRRSRYIGHAKTHLQHVMTAAAFNGMRIPRWLADEPKAATRRSPFAQLYQSTA